MVLLFFRAKLSNYESELHTAMHRMHWVVTGREEVKAAIEGSWCLSNNLPISKSTRTFNFQSNKPLPSLTTAPFIRSDQKKNNQKINRQNMEGTHLLSQAALLRCLRYCPFPSTSFHCFVSNAGIISSENKHLMTQQPKIKTSCVVFLADLHILMNKLYRSVVFYKPLEISFCIFFINAYHRFLYHQVTPNRNNTHDFFAQKMCFDFVRLYIQIHS